METTWLWGLFLISTAAAVLLFRVRAAIQAIRNWPQVRGFVLPESIVLKKAGWSPPSGRQGLYVTEVSFEYEVNGRKYKGCRMVPVGWTIRDDEQERFRAELENFSKVLYNPADPAKAYLDIPDRFQRGSLSWITFSLVSSILVVLFLGAALLTNAF